MAAAIAAAAFALYLAAPRLCLAGAGNDREGESSGAGRPFRGSPSHPSSPPLEVSSSQQHERRPGDDGDGFSWPLVGATTDRSLGRSRDRSQDRSPDRSLRGERRARPGISGGRSRNLRVAWADEGLPAPHKQIGVFADVGGDWREFPSLEESTVMFLHIFKCAGSTTRRMMVAWAEAEGLRGAVIASCDDPWQEEKICLSHYRLLDGPVQTEIMARQKVLAGHFLWGFQGYVLRPYLMITALRNPLEVFVSAKQYTNKGKTKTLAKAVGFVSDAMIETLEDYGAGQGPLEAGSAPQGRAQPQIGGFIFRLVGRSKNHLRGKKLERAAAEAVQNLEKFWIVGLVEQYAGFEEVVKRSLDPSSKHGDLWGLYSTQQFNTSPVGSREVLAAMDPDLVQHFNNSLALQWEVYGKAVALWGVRCRDVLPSAMHQEKCAVGSPPTTYGSLS